MKLVGIITDKNLTLMGFKAQGKESEFGGMGAKKVEQTLTLNYLHKIKFNNTQAYFNGTVIQEKGSFKLSGLPMYVYDGQDLNPVNNTIKLAARYVYMDQNVGFDAIIGDSINKKLKYADVIKLTELFRPVNFVVRIQSNGKQYIAGKSHQPISELPIVEIGEYGVTAKRTKSGATSIGPVTGAKLVNEVDILELFEFIGKYNGYVIKFPDTKYEATGETVEKANEAFTSIGIGEVGDPRLVFNATKFNASCRFRNPGIINISTGAEGPIFAGSTVPVYTFIYRSKNIFFNGEHHLTKIGVVLPNSAVDELYRVFGTSMAISEVTDEKTVSVVNRLINWSDSKIFEVDVSKLALISPNNWSRYIMSYEDIYKNTLALSILQIRMKYGRRALKDLNEAGFTTIPRGRHLAPQFALKSQTELEQLINAGIDVFTGAYTEPGSVTSNPHAPATDASVEVSYIVDGYNPANYDYKKLTTKRDAAPPQVLSFMNKVESIADLAERARYLSSEMDAMGIEEEKIKRALWLHKTSMWLKADRRGVHMGEDKVWEINTKKRTKATCYDCKSPDAKGLQLLVINTDIK